MAEYKCSICGFRFESDEMPEECASCKRNGRRKTPEFEELEPRVGRSNPADEQPAPYHWRCKDDGHKFVAAGVPVECPVCVRHGRVSKKLIPLTDEARTAAAEAAVDDDVTPIAIPSVKSTKAEIIEILKQYGCKTIRVAGIPVPLEDCVNRTPPNKENLLALYLEVSTGEENDGADVGAEPPAGPHNPPRHPRDNPVG